MLKGGWIEQNISRKIQKESNNKRKALKMVKKGS